MGGCWVATVSLLYTEEERVEWVEGGGIAWGYRFPFPIVIFDIACCTMSQKSTCESCMQKNLPFVRGLVGCYDELTLNLGPDKVGFL